MKIPKGCRWLRVGEIKRHRDRFLSGGGWCSTNFPGLAVLKSKLFIRRVTKVKRK